MTHHTDAERAKFEAVASDDGKWPQAIERDAKGNYLLLTTAHGWMWWQAARRAQVGAVPQWDGVIKPSDFIVDTFRRGSSGWVPKPDNCVRITHRPTGFFEEEAAMRSVHANKAVAWQRLSDRLESLAAAPQPPEVAQASVSNGTLASHVMLPCVERIDVLEVAKELKENISAFGDTKGKAKERAAFYLVSQHEQLLYWQQQVRQLLAAAKVERKPLTDEAIRTLYGESDGHWQMVGPQVLCFARSIESAHGIQEQST